MLIDAHCHLPNNIAEIGEIIRRAETNDVTKMIAIGTDLKENTQVLRISQHFPNIYGAIGIYPHNELLRNIDDLITQLRQQIRSSPKVCAVGECGIDISNWEGGRSVDTQIELFEKQIQLAIEFKLPLVIHNRNGNKEVVDLLARYKGQIVGVAHCFDGNMELAQQYLDLGFYISFSGFVTYNSKQYLQEVALNVPLERILVETDSPYIVPKSIKEKHNEPKNVKIVAQKLADIRNLPYEDVAVATYDNTVKLFKLEI